MASSPPDRAQSLVGLVNFRDFGGVKTASDRMVVTNRLFRCGHLAGASMEAMDHLLSLNFDVIADLRYTREQRREPSSWPAELDGRILFHGQDRAGDAPHLALLRERNVSVDTVDAMYLAFYASFPFHPNYMPLIGKVICHSSRPGTRLLVHCSAGKDRTGIVCALLLDVLGVPRAVIMDDYMRSASAPALHEIKDRIFTSTPDRYADSCERDTVDALFGVKPSYLAAFFTAIEGRFSSTAAYLHELGVDAEIIRSIKASFTQPIE